jgi:hypothetical protein
MTIRSLLRRACVALPLAVWALGARSAEGRKPLYKPLTDVVGDGSYFVASDIPDEGQGWFLRTLFQSNMTLDLAGHVVTGNGNPMFLEQYKNLVVRNGTVDGAGTANPLVNIVGYGLGSIAVVEDLVIRGGLTVGLQSVQFDVLILRNVTVENVGSYAVYATGARLVVIEDCVFRKSLGQALRLPGPATVQIRNTRFENTGTGDSTVYSGFTASLLIGNTLHDAHQQGILLVNNGQEGANLIAENVVEGAGTDGLEDDVGANLFLENNLSGNGNGMSSGSGLVTYGNRNVLIGNHLTANGNIGLRFALHSCQNFFGNNSASENLGNLAPACAGPPQLFPPDSCSEGSPGSPGCSNGLLNVTFGLNLIPGPPPY